MEIEGKQIKIDTSGVGNNWVIADEDSCPANIQQEIAAEIIDGKVSVCRDYLASNGCHYRWEGMPLNWGDLSENMSRKGYMHGHPTVVDEE